VSVSRATGAGRFAKIGLPMSEFFGPFVGSFEIACGSLVLIGQLTRLAVIPLLVIMAVALATTKWPMLADQGFWHMARESRTDCCVGDLVESGESESDDEVETRKRRMEMDAVNAVERVARQSRRVVVVDVALLRVEHIQHVDEQFHAFAKEDFPLSSQKLLCVPKAFMVRSRLCSRVFGGIFFMPAGRWRRLELSRPCVSCRWESAWRRSSRFRTAREY
jgi:hypothetical protein